MASCLGELLRGVHRSCLFVGVWNSQGTQWLLWGALWHLSGKSPHYPSATHPFSGKSTAGCHSSRHRGHPREQFLLRLENVLWGGQGRGSCRRACLGCRWKSLFKYGSIFMSQLVVCFYFLFFSFSLLNLLLREICDYIFFFSAQVLECIAQTQTYPTS